MSSAPRASRLMSSAAPRKPPNSTPCGRSRRGCGSHRRCEMGRAPPVGIVRRLFHFPIATLALGEFHHINHLARVMGKMQCLAAIDRPFLSGDELAERRTQEDDRCRNIFHISHMPEHVAIELEPLLGIDPVSYTHLRAHE